jgi:hypothetical protein
VSSARAALLAVVAAALATLLAAAGGPQLADIDVVCPLFGHHFTAQTAVSDSTVVAFDSDLCRRPPGESPYLLSVWTCPYCFFSAYQADFRGSLEPKYRDLELIRYPLDPKVVEQADIFPATKYLNAEAFYKLAGKDARFLADLTLRGSYACRVAEVEEPPELAGLRATLRDAILDGKRRISVEEVHLELAADIRRRLGAGEVPADRERIYRYLLADALRQAGQRIEARSLFEALAADDKLPDAYRQAARRKGFLCEREGAFQEKALAYLEQSESAALLPDDERAVAVYLQGELARRLGRIDAARAQYARAATQPSVPEWLAPIIRQQQGRLPAASPAPSAGGASGNG